MSGTTRRRRHPPAVYRRRRLTVLLGLVLVAAAIWLLIAQPWRGWAAALAAAPSASAPTSESTDATTAIPVPDTGASQTPASEATGPVSPSPAATSVDEASAPSTSPPAAPAVEPCRARDVTVEAVTDQDTYASGQNPQLSIRLTNIAAADCTINVGTATQAFVITSGSDTWWRSTDCQSASSDAVVTLKAGQSVSSAAPLGWDRTRSSVSTCGEAERARAAGGGASYHLSVEIGGFSSAQSKQFILY